MDNTRTLVSYSTRLHDLESTFIRALAEIRSLAQEVDHALQQSKMSDSPAEKLSLGFPRPDSPVVFTPLSPPPHPKSLRRARSSLPVSSNNACEIISGSLLIGN